MRHHEMTQQQYRESYSRYRKARDIVRQCEHLELRANYFQSRAVTFFKMNDTTTAREYRRKAARIHIVCGNVKRSALARTS